jgi:hypothetical protein
MPSASISGARAARTRRTILGSADLWRHELGRARAGWGVLALFAAGWCCYLMLVRLLDPRITGWQELRQPAWTTLRGFLPIVCGLGVASVLGAAPVFELHLATPVSLRLTLARRMSLVVAPALVLALVGWVATYPAGLWGESVVTSALELAGPLVALAGGAALAAAISGSARFGAAAVVLIWAGILFRPQGDAALVLAGLGAAAAAWVALGLSDRTLKTARSW